VQINGVFEGGGVKAIALVGAVKAAEEQGVRFHQMAGTSSGALVASLLAAGYTADEMKNIILETPFTTFLTHTWLHDLRLIGPAIRLLFKKGLYSGQELERWVQNKLEAKGVRSFGDLPHNKIRIIASDISQGRIVILPEDIAQYGIDPKRFLISKAVRMSTSIPYFFDPVVLRKPPESKKNGKSFADQFAYIVDGGLLSNFPLWIFDQQYADVSDKELLPTIGLRLVDRHTNKPHRIIGPFTMFQALFATMMEAHDERYIEEKNRFRTIKIPTLGVRMTDFNIAPAKSMELYESGYNAAKQFFQRWSQSVYISQFNQYIRKPPRTKA
jgi:NTE family protein